MAMTNKTITVFGGSGFIGRHLVQRLAATDVIVRIAVRDTEGANYLRLMGGIGQIVPIATDIGDEYSVASAINGADSVVNLVGLLYESGKQNFERIHASGAAHVAAAASVSYTHLTLPTKA